MHKRSGFLLLLISFLIFNYCSPAVLAAPNNPASISITVDGRLITTDEPPLIQNGRTMVPLRAVGEALKLQVNWNSADQTITLNGAELTMVLTIGSNKALVNQTVRSLEAVPVIRNSRTMVPLRFISEAVGCSVSWNESARLVAISSPSVPLKVLGYYALGNSWQDLFGTVYPESSRGNTDLVQTAALGWYTLDQDGNLSTQSSGGWSQPDGWEDVLKAAEYYRLKTQMTVHMTDKDSAIVNLLSSESAQNSAVASITQCAAQYDGVNLDLEGLGWNDTGAERTRVQQLFSKFISRLAASLHQSNKTLALSLHPLNSAYYGYDYGALGLDADQIIIMAYDYGPKPEPLDQVQQAVTQAQAVVTSDKLYLGISIPSETEASINDKISLASQSHLAGIAIWRLGLMSDAMWEQLRINPHLERQD